jgi:AcrR family transcriptional regulator/DNA-binding Xre family transcriptional regulator
VREAAPTLGARVRELRVAKGLTQGHLARRAGFSDAYISKIERGAGALRNSTVQRLAEALEVPPDALGNGDRGGAPADAAGRREILSAAVALFSAKGYSRVSIRELAARAGCSTANLYHHFPSKVDIFVTLIEGAMVEHFAGLQEALERHDDPVEQLRYVLRNHLLVHMTRPEVRLLSDDFHPMTGRTLERFIAERDRYELGVRDVVARGVREGVFEVDDPAVAVRAAMGACNYVDRWFRPEGPLSAEQVAQGIADFLVAGFGARRRPGGPRRRADTG